MNRERVRFLVKWTAKKLTKFSVGVFVIIVLCFLWQFAQACSRILYETGKGTYITGRGMDWNDSSAKTALWIFPVGMERDGGTKNNPIKWTSKFGSVITSFYDMGTADGMNEKGLVGNMLYLAESDYGDPAKTDKPTITIGGWLQYFFDNYATVKDVVTAMENPPFAIVATPLPNGRATTMHLSFSDSSGDSAILEYIQGKLTIHHDPAYKVMTNSPVYDQQLALNSYWNLIDGHNFLPGTISAADRFVRLSYNLKSSPKYENSRWAVASVFSQLRAIGVPLGMNNPNHPNLSMTLWRTVADHGARVYYFESALMPSLLWVDLNKVDFKSGVSTIAIDPDKVLAGDVSEKFKTAKPFSWSIND